ncbi:MAG: hypothetical protein NWE94_04680 [Candidatus Bathyarchaeota archaeon]|nr:hypothetical protein [Candidatus Bathyarchaeota archaeon]
MQKHTLIAAILVLLASAIALIYYFAKSNLLFYATGVFWDGAITGFAGCLFLLSLILAIYQRTTKDMSTKKISLVFSMLTLSFLVTAILFLFKPGDSDVWWYGVIAGFLGCLLLVFLVLVALLLLKLTSKESP